MQYVKLNKAVSPRKTMDIQVLTETFRERSGSIGLLIFKLNFDSFLACI
jgi:hypothetical protein